MGGKRNVSVCRGHELANALYSGKHWSKMAKGVSKERRKFEKLQRQDKIKERIFFKMKSVFTPWANLEASRDVSIRVNRGWFSTTN